MPQHTIEDSRKLKEVEDPTMQAGETLEMNVCLNDESDLPKVTLAKLLTVSEMNTHLAQRRKLDLPREVIGRIGGLWLDISSQAIIHDSLLLMRRSVGWIRSGTLLRTLRVEIKTAIANQLLHFCGVDICISFEKKRHFLDEVLWRLCGGISTGN